MSVPVGRRVVSPDKLLPWLVAGVTLAVFSGVVACGFVRWDDDLHVYENPWLHPVTPAHLGHLWRAPYEGLYVPLSYSVFALLAVAGRDPATGLLNPHLFHAVNLALHLANVLLVYVLLRRLVNHAGACAVGALMFAIHPVQVESVAWVSELRGLLSGLLSLLTLWQYLAFIRGMGAARRGAWVRYALATLAFVLALLAKPSAVVVPLLAWILARGAGERPPVRALWPLAAWAVPALVVVLCSRTAQPVPPSLLITAWQRLFVAGDALAFSLAHLVWPARLGIDYGRTPAVVLGHWWGYVSWLVPVMVCAGCWAGRRRFPLLATAGALFATALLPVLGLVPFTFQQISTVADRYLYLAMLGPALATAALLARIPRRAVPLTAGLCAGVLLLLGLQSALQVFYWQNDLALFTRALAVNPRSWSAENDLGATMYEHGQTMRAIAAFEAALRWNPRQEKTWNNLGAVLNAVGRRRDAEAALKQALWMAPDYAAADNNLGLIAAEEGRWSVAEADYRAALRSDPTFAEAQNNLGVVLERQGRWEDAASQFRQALALSPGYTSARQNLDRVMVAKCGGK